jgi:hypothetical protein
MPGGENARTAETIGPHLAAWKGSRLRATRIAQNIFLFPLTLALSLIGGEEIKEEWIFSKFYGIGPSRNLAGFGGGPKAQEQLVKI